MTVALSGHLPYGTLVVTSLDGDTWQFEYSRLTDKVYYEFEEAVDLWDVGEYQLAEERYLKLIRDFPEFVDAYHHLALVLSAQGKEAEAFRVWKEVVQLALSCLPEEFERGAHQLPWVFLGNRPFLRAYHGLGLEYLERGRVKEALGIFKELITMNPSDNQGIRSLVVYCSFKLKRPGEVVELANRFPHDAIEGVVYGRALALYQLGNLEEAEKALKRAIEMYPLIAEELLKEDHPQPEGLRPDRVILGGADQAYYYWMEHYEYWEDTPGALDLVNRFLGEVIN
jgi:tetratricopeptide (TPR) repeat protein